MLNAFRHQRFDTSALCSLSAFCLCAQRLSASEIRHSIEHKINPTSRQCSTPFGIRDSTQEIYLFSIPSSSAQRLSASEIRHLCPKHCQQLLDSVLNAFRHQRFDTICGRPTNYRNFTVLNAFRHQRFDTIGGSTTSRRHYRAQRLSASEIRHNKTVTFSCEISNCAQRLSASEIRHDFTKKFNQEVASVLNAFRHQRFDTKESHPKSPRIISVLNAFRHQRFDTQSANST